MRHRRVANPEPHLAKAIDSGPAPGRIVTFEDALVDAGVPDSAIPRVVQLVNERSLIQSADALRSIVRALGKSPAGVALNRALLGDDGRSYEADAKVAGCDRVSLFRAVERIQRRLDRCTKTEQQAA